MSDTELAILVDRFMRQIHMSLQAKASGFDTENVGPGGGMVLLTLADMGPSEMHELTRRVARDKSQMTRLMKSLETKGLLERTTSKADARVSIVSLTPFGNEVVDTLRRAVAEAIGQVLSPITAQEKEQLKDLMRKALG